MFERSSHLINKKFKEYLIPTTLSGMSMMLGAIVDGIIVGKTIGADAMATVNVAEPIVLLFQTLFFCSVWAVPHWSPSLKGNGTTVRPMQSTHWGA